VKPLVVVDENIPGVSRLLGESVEIRAAAGREIDPAILDGADALLVRSVTRVNAALLQGSKIRFLGSATSGTDHVDLDFLSGAGIPFAHAPGSNANSVVEYVLAAIAATPGKLEHLLRGGRVGIIGFGIIGSAMASRLQQLGINYCAYDPWLDPSTVGNPADLDQVLCSDVVTLHAELTHRRPWPSYHLLGDGKLSILKKGALLINASRGAVIDNRCLLERLESGEFDADLVLDVWEGEPAINSQLLRRVRLGTHHVAGYSYDGKLLATRMLCEELAAVLGLELLEAPTPGLPPIHLAPTYDDAQLLRQALLLRYDIRSDDGRLRAATLDRPPADAAAAFDRLRREYPRRRELAGSTVFDAGFTGRQLDLLRALGCLLLGDGPQP
jgi:erythronate-4-phosphate dehydrogenase